MTNPDETTVEAVAKALDEHTADLDETAVYMGGCSCGWRSDDGSWEVFTQHQARAALAAIPEPECDGVHPENAKSAAERFLWRQHSETLNDVAWRIARALGDVPEGATQIEGDVLEQVDRLIAKAAIPEPATVGGVTREQVLEALWSIRMTGEGREAYIERSADAILALFTPAPSTVGTVEEFNERHPIGTPVRYWPGARHGEGRESVTRSRAWELGGSPVVAVEGYSGGIALTHIDLLTPATTRDVGGVTEAQLYSLAESYAYERWPDETVEDDPELITGPSMSTVLGWLKAAGIPYRAASAKGDGK